MRELTPREEWVGGFLRFDPSPFRRALMDFDLRWLNPKAAPNGRAGWRSLVYSSAGLVPGRWLSSATRKDRRRAAKLLDLFPAVQSLRASYDHGSRSRGVEAGDFMRLYLAVRTLQPHLVLECGTGMSTIALAAALKDNQEESGRAGRCVSMEDIPEWADHARSLVPRQLSSFVEIVLSPRVELEFDGCWGVGYQDVPDRDYDFVFVDGPQPFAPVSGERRFNADVIAVARRRPGLWGLIDNRLSTVMAVQRALRESHDVWYDPVAKLGFIRPRRVSN